MREQKNRRAVLEEFQAPLGEKDSEKTKHPQAVFGGCLPARKKSRNMTRGGQEDHPHKGKHVRRSIRGRRGHLRGMERELVGTKNALNHRVV